MTEAATANLGRPARLPPPPIPATMTLRVACVSADSEFQSLEAEWNGLLARSAADNIFLTWEWVSTWWELYGAGAHLYVLTARDDAGTLIGLAPLQRRPHGIFGLGAVDVLEFIGWGGDVTPEHLDFIVVAGAEAAVIPAFAACIGADRRIRGVDLRPFSSRSPNRRFVAEALRAGPGHVREVRDSICPVLPLPATTAEFMASRSRNYRKKMGEYQRRAARDLGARVRVSASPGELEADMKTLIALHHRRWQGRSRSFRSRAYLEFHRRLALRLFEKGRLRLLTLDSTHGPLATLYCFSYGRRFSFYQSGRDPAYGRQRVGLVLMHRAIELAIEEGAELFDFLRGEEDYKYMWAAGELDAVRFVYWKSWPARAVGWLAGVIPGAQVPGWAAPALLLGAAAAACRT